MSKNEKLLNSWMAINIVEHSLRNEFNRNHKHNLVLIELIEIANKIMDLIENKLKTI